MSVDPPRIFCPRCRASNFVGQTNCWQCGASLPPPEVGGYAPVGAPVARGAQPQAPQAYVPVPQWGEPQPAFHQRSTSKASKGIWFGVITVIFVIFGVIGLLVYRLNAKQGNPKDDLQAQIEKLKAQQGAMIGKRDSGNQGEDIDPTTQEAKREIERLRKKAGLQAPEADFNGNIQLQTGGRLTTEDWNKAKSSVHKSSTYNPP